MEYTTAGSSATFATDPDRVVQQVFANANATATSSGGPITVLSTDSAGRAVTFALSGHDHTLGNALRWQLASYGEQLVEFCGYSMPHPSESRVHLRVQVATGAPAGVTAVTLLRQALLDLKALYGDIRDQFESAVPK